MTPRCKNERGFLGGSWTFRRAWEKMGAVAAVQRGGYGEDDIPLHFFQHIHMKINKHWGGWWLNAGEGPRTRVKARWFQVSQFQRPCSNACESGHSNIISLNMGQRTTEHTTWSSCRPPPRQGRATPLQALRVSASHRFPLKLTMRLARSCSIARISSSSSTRLAWHDAVTIYAAIACSVECTLNVQNLCPAFLVFDMPTALNMLLFKSLHVSK